MLTEKAKPFDKIVLCDEGAGSYEWLYKDIDFFIHNHKPDEFLAMEVWGQCIPAGRRRCPMLHVETWRIVDR